MKNVLAIVAMTGFLVVPQVTSAASPAAVSYDDAIRCAAVDTLISSIAGGDDATPENKKLSEHYDNVTEKWLAMASEGPGGQDKALADYLTVSTAMADKITSASNADGIEASVAEDLKFCIQLEASTFGSAGPGN